MSEAPIKMCWSVKKPRMANPHSLADSLCFSERASSASCVFTYDGSIHRFGGRLNSQLILERTIRRGKRAPLTVRIQS